MEILYSKHWIKKNKRKRKDITNDMLEFALINSTELKDKRWKNVLNAISRIPPPDCILFLENRNHHLCVKHSRFHLYLCLNFQAIQAL